MEDGLTIRDVAIMTGLHRNTIRNYVKAGRIKATLIDEGTGRQRYLIDRDDLYNCGIQKVLSHLGPLEVQERLYKDQAAHEKGGRSVDTLGELIRLNRELLTAREELAGLRSEIPMLRAGVEERDHLRGERERLRDDVNRLAIELAEARAAARWSYRRRQKRGARTVYDQEAGTPPSPVDAQTSEG